jgi:hypothetical protein
MVCAGTCLFGEACVGGGDQAAQDAEGMDDGKCMVCRGLCCVGEQAGKVAMSGGCVSW